MSVQVGFVGIGNMGWPMAANVARAGFVVTVFDLDPERAGRWAAEHGGSVAADLEALASAVDVVVTMLPTGAEVRQCMAAMGGGLRPGTVVVDMSSADPVGTRQLAAHLAERRVTLVDAPVSGAVPRAVNGTLAIMAAGDPAAIETVRPVLAAMGDRIFGVGASGNGHAMKALNNFVAGSAFVAASEALLVGERFGLDRATMLEVMNASTARCFNTEMVMGPQVVSGQFASGFAMGLLAKDVGIAASLAGAMGRVTPVADLVAAVLADARDALGFGQDHTRAYELWAGRERP